MKTAIYLDDDYAALLVLLMKAHVLDIRNGSFEVFIDSEGMPGKMKKNEYFTLSPSPAIDPLVRVVI